MTNKEIILYNLKNKIQELEKSNKKATEASVPSWCVIDHDRGMIDGIRFAIKEIEANMRDCENCKHHTENGCSSWDCEFEPKDGCDNDHDCEHCDWTECPVEEEQDA